MQTEVLKKSIKTLGHTSGQALALGLEAERIKTRLSNHFEDSVLEARRSLKRGRHAAEDLFDDTTYRVKQNPWSALGLTLGLGFGLGTLAGWLVTRGLGRCAKQSDR